MPFSTKEVSSMIVDAGGCYKMQNKLSNRPFTPPPCVRDAQLEAVPSLGERLAAMLEVQTSAAALDRLWTLTGAYSAGADGDFTYVMDEVGSRLLPPDAWGEEGDGDGAVFSAALLYDARAGAAITAIWPRRAAAKGEVATCEGLPRGRAKWRAVQSALAPLQLRDRDDADGAAVMRARAWLTAEAAEGEEERTDVSSDAQWEHTLSPLRQTLAEAAFTVPGLARVLGFDGGDAAVGYPLQKLSLPPVAAEVSHALPEEGSDALCDLVRLLVLNLMLHGSDALCDLVRLFVLNLTLPAPLVVALLGDATAALLLRLAVLHGGEGRRPADMDSSSIRLASTVQLCPLRHGAVVATDFAQTSSRRHGVDPVMHVGVDSLGLAAAAPPPPPLRSAAVLDVCCGSGVQAIIALAGGAGSAHLTDVSARAARFARFNLALNGMLSKAQASADIEVEVYIDCEVFFVFHGSLYDALPPDARYDVILCNPPYIPNPGDTAALEGFGAGGSGGEEVLSAVVAGAQKRLKGEGGGLYVVSNLVNPEQYADKAKRWWSSDAGGAAGGASSPQPHVQMTVSYGRPWTAEEYAALITEQGNGDGDAVAAAYAQALQEAGIHSVANGFVFATVQGAAAAAAVAQHEAGSGALAQDVEVEVEVEVRREADDIWQAVAVGADIGLLERIRGGGGNRCTLSHCFHAVVSGILTDALLHVQICIGVNGKALCAHKS
ncbi:hypothetical protein JKP88DRAFT_318847 [Tribonema minus]|uniref:Methyltransferase small domain-containing protein n=1 Tax=Tribonema minus TaxID=303371 RepID=A0A835YVW5_9STRA|nr:hypothetical protein JKP88DRAFT_318847 [Tribonema minus]